MKKYFALIALAALGAGLSTSAQAQDAYVGVGLPGLYSLGYAHPLGSRLGLRAEYAGGLSVNKDGNQEGVNVTGSFKANRFGAFADWFVFEGKFRLVGGVTMNDMKVNYAAVGGISTINGKQVDLTDANFNVVIKFPSTTPYLGIGFGHQQSDSKGLGFYADVGVMVGSFTVTPSSSLVGRRVIGGQPTELLQQSDVDAQMQTMRDALSSIGAFPSASLGLVYRY